MGAYDNINTEMVDFMIESLKAPISDKISMETLLVPCLFVKFVNNAECLVASSTHIHLLYLIKTNK